MNRKDNTTKGKGKVSSSDLRRKEKECRKLQQELTQVCNKLEKSIKPIDILYFTQLLMIA